MRAAIIGAGICGLYLARKLSEKGEAVTVFEKREKIGKEACSGLFSERILEFIPESEDLIQNQINHCLIYFPKRTLKLKFSKRFLVMSHAELDRLVACLAEKSGAKILLKSDFNIEKSGFSDFDRIIGCDGALSATRRGSGLKDPEFFLGIQGFVGGNDFSDYVETWATDNGFIWRIPRGREVEWGIMEKPEIAKPVFDNFLRKNNINLGGIKAWLIPQGLIMSANPKVALLGDAAGLCKPWSGGGVIWGLKACDILLKNFPNFVKYRKVAEIFFKPRIILSRIAKKMIYFSGRNLSWLLPKNYKIESDFLWR